MFVRMLTMNVKPGKGPGLVAIVEETHIPVLRMFAGFRDQITMLSPDGKQVIAMSFWDGPDLAETYKREGYARILAATEPLIDGTPELSTFEVIYSTAYQIRSRSTAA